MFAKKAFSIRRWFSAAELAHLQRYSMEQANRWGKFGQLPKDQNIPFCANFAQELAAAYGSDSEWERDAAWWASEMAKWESVVKNPEYQRHRSHKDVEELFDGMFSRIDHCQELGAIDDPVKFWNSVARKRLEEAKHLLTRAAAECDEAKKQALTEQAKKAKKRANEAETKAAFSTLRRYGILGLFLGFLLGWSPRRRIKLLRLFGILSQQEAEFAMIVESNDGVPAVLTNFRGCRKTKVCKRYEAHAWLIGRKCVYISHDPEKHLSPIELFSQVVQSNASSIISVFSSAATLVARKHPLLVATAAVILGLFAPERVRHGVAIFDDITSKALYKDATAEEKKGAADDKPKLAEYTSIPIVVDAAYNGKAYGDGSWIQVVVSSNEGVLLLQRDLNKSKYGYESFPTASAEELQGAIKDYIKEKLRESKKAGTSSKSSEKNFPPPTVDEIERAVERYGEWWGRSIRFWILPFNNNDPGFHERMRSAKLTANEIGKLATELDLMCSSGPAPLIGSPPVDVSEFNEAFALIGGKGLLEDAVRGLYGNNNMDIDVHHFPRRLLHSVMYSLVTAKPITVFTDKLEEKLADVNKRPVPLSKGSWDLSRDLLSPLGQGWLKRIRRFLIFWGKKPSCSEKSGKGIISDNMQTRAKRS